MKALLLSLLRYLSLPFALLYGVVMMLRNFFYDKGIFSSIGFSLPVISVGNLAVGGTGKTPHIEYLVSLLQETYMLATLSRGYKRYTRGFRIAGPNSDAREIGDEPFQFKMKFPDLTVCVAEERMTAIPELLQKKPALDVILLDDAFQHRTVKPGLNILLTDHRRPYTRDHIMPFGLLREGRQAAARADIIIVTKCPPDLSVKDKEALVREIAPRAHQSIYFSAIDYLPVYPAPGTQAVWNSEHAVLLVCGIANPDPLISRIRKKCSAVYPLTYNDHHYFTEDDISDIIETYGNIPEANKVLLTTEKDATRLLLHQDALHAAGIPVFIQPIGIHFLFDDAEGFRQEVMAFIHSIIPPPADHDVIDAEEIQAAPGETKEPQS